MSFAKQYHPHNIFSGVVFLGVVFLGVVFLRQQSAEGTAKRFLRAVPSCAKRMINRCVLPSGGRRAKTARLPAELTFGKRYDFAGNW
jgi:hypothetical protein